MGFYIRKSIRVGPIRFNLSKSGIGVSTGIPGLRVGTGPRGNYIHVGGAGLYYRQTIPSQPTQSSPVVERRPLAPVHVPPTTHGPMEEITSGCVTQMIDSSSSKLLAELERKRKQIQWWPFAVGFAIAATLLLFAVRVTPWITVPAIVLMAVGAFLVYQRDVLKKSVVMMYDLDEQSETAYHGLYDAATSLARCGATWHVNARADVYDSKYHAGAGHLVSRRLIRIAERDPPFVRTNLSINYLPLGLRALYFFPDRILVYAPNGVGALSYDDLQIEVSTSRFIEDGYVPRDARVVDRTWQYVNKSGGPDRRFKDNRELPVCLYEEIRFHSNSGLNELLQVSRIGVGDALRQSIAQIASVIAAAKKAQENRKQETQPAPVYKSFHEVDSKHRAPVATPDCASMEEIYETLFDVLCCVVVADGRVSPTEKTRMIELMAKARVPWAPDVIEARISQFIKRTQKTGYNRVLEDALDRVSIFKRIGREDVLLRCVDSMAGADGKLTIAEKNLCSRIREAVS